MTEVHGVVLRAANPDQLARWYASHFGIDATAEHGTGVAFAGTDDDSSTPGSAWSITVAVPDLDEAVARLRATGNTVELTERGETGVAISTDPEGNELRLRSRGPAAEASTDRADEPTIDAPAPDEQATEPRTRSRVALWLPAALILVATVTFVVIVQPTTTSTRQSASESSSNQAPTTTPTSTDAADSVEVADVGGPIAGINAGWDVFVGGDHKVVRIELSTGRITTTTLPNDSVHVTSLVLGRNAVFVATTGESDNPDYVVPDGKPATRAPINLADSSRVIPGPEPGQLWTSTRSAKYTLRSFDGTTVGPTVTIPDHLRRVPVQGSDHNGHMVFYSRAGGYYAVTGNGTHRIATGRLLALGPNTALTLKCDERGRCHKVVTNRDTDEQHALNSKESIDISHGVIAPNGSIAAVVAGFEVKLINLDSGAVRVLPRQLHMMNPSISRMVFAPNSRWLFIALPNTLAIIDLSTGDIHRVRISLNNVSAIALRNPV